jgi:hypothetical protein
MVRIVVGTPKLRLYEEDDMLLEATFDNNLKVVVSHKPLVASLLEAEGHPVWLKVKGHVAVAGGKVETVEEVKHV